MDNFLSPPYSTLKSELENELALDEGYRRNIYRCSEGKLTIGYGVNLTAGLSEDESLILMRYKLSKIQTALDMQFPWFKLLTDRRKRALINMSYQLGISGLLKFKKMLRALGQGDWVTAEAEALDSEWYNQTPERAKRIAHILRVG